MCLYIIFPSFILIFHLLCTQFNSTFMIVIDINKKLSLNNFIMSIEVDLKGLY